MDSGGDFVVDSNLHLDGELFNDPEHTWPTFGLDSYSSLVYNITHFLPSCPAKRNDLTRLTAAPDNTPLINSLRKDPKIIVPFWLRPGDLNYFPPRAKMRSNPPSLTTGHG